jgi:hypothetical protein
MKEELIAGSYGIEARYPFLDPAVVQEFLSLVPALKNDEYVVCGRGTSEASGASEASERASEASEASKLRGGSAEVLPRRAQKAHLRRKRVTGRAGGGRPSFELGERAQRTSSANELGERAQRVGRLGLLTR